MTFDPDLVALAEAGQSNAYDWILVDRDGLRWIGETRDGVRGLVVPNRFRTDLASVPRFLSWLFPRYGKYTKAAVAHDFLCQHLADLRPDAPSNVVLPDGVVPLTLRDRSDADAVFLRMMSELQVPWARRLLIWSAVSWATVLTAIWPGRKDAKTWIARGLLVLLVLALLAGWLTGFFALFLSDDGDGLWWQALLLAAVALAIVGVWMVIAGIVALGRPDRLTGYLGAVGFTLLSLPLLLGGVFTAVLLFGYLLVEGLFSRFEPLRNRRASVTRPDSPRRQRLEAITKS